MQLQLTNYHCLPDVVDQSDANLIDQLPKIKKKNKSFNNKYITIFELKDSLLAVLLSDFYNFSSDI